MKVWVADEKLNGFRRNNKVRYHLKRNAFLIGFVAIFNISHIYIYTHTRLFHVRMIGIFINPWIKN